MASPFLALPAELRTAIYEYVYLYTHAKPVDLLHPEPPAKPLLLTSKQLLHESQELYKSSYRLYWTSTAFHLDARAVPDSIAARATLLSLRHVDFNRITNLTISTAPTDIPHCISRTCTLVSNLGGWHLFTITDRTGFHATTNATTYDTRPSTPLGDHITVTEERSTYRRYRRWLTRIGPAHPSLPNPLKLAWDEDKDAEALKLACRKPPQAGTQLSVRNEVFEVLSWSLEDGEAVAAATYTIFGAWIWSDGELSSAVQKRKVSLYDGMEEVVALQRPAVSAYLCQGFTVSYCQCKCFAVPCCPPPISSSVTSPTVRQMRRDIHPLPSQDFP